VCELLVVLWKDLELKGFVLCFLVKMMNSMIQLTCSQQPNPQFTFLSYDLMLKNALQINLFGLLSAPSTNLTTD